MFVYTWLKQCTSGVLFYKSVNQLQPLKTIWITFLKKRVLEFFFRNNFLAKLKFGNFWPLTSIEHN